MWATAWCGVQDGEPSAQHCTPGAGVSSLRCVHCTGSFTAKSSVFTLRSVTTRLALTICILLGILRLIRMSHAGAAAEFWSSLHRFRSWKLNVGTSCST